MPKAFYQSGSYTAARRRFRLHFRINRNRPVPSVNSIKLWLQNFENIGETRNRRGGSARSVRTPENIERVRQEILGHQRVDTVLDLEFQTVVSEGS